MSSFSMPRVDQQTTGTAVTVTSTSDDPTNPVTLSPAIRKGVEGTSLGLDDRRDLPAIPT